MCVCVCVFNANAIEVYNFMILAFNVRIHVFHLSLNVRYLLILSAITLIISDAYSLLLASLPSISTQRRKSRKKRVGRKIARYEELTRPDAYESGSITTPIRREEEPKLIGAADRAA